MADRQDEPVAPDPPVVAGVPAHDLLEEQVGGGGEAHRRARVPVTDLLDGIRREDPCRVDGLLVDRIPLESCHESRPFSFHGKTRRIVPLLVVHSPDFLGTTAGGPTGPIRAVSGISGIGLGGGACGWQALQV